MILTSEYLNEAYREGKEINNDAYDNKLQFVAEHVFDFTTYDNEIDEILARRMVEVIDSILQRTTFEYIKDRDRYINYITMINMPFLHGKLEWGTSIRGAWFDKKEDEQSMRELLKWINEKA